MENNYQTHFTSANQTSFYLHEYEMMKTQIQIQHFDKRNTISENNGTSYTSSEKKEDVQDQEMRRHKYVFKTRSQVDILDDGYRWRKYGQKSLKNNSFPRSYYKCTYKDCNVKKQIQRNTGDEELVMTTYQGEHTHQPQTLPNPWNQS